MQRPAKVAGAVSIGISAGAMAEWLGRGLQNLVRGFDSRSRLHQINKEELKGSLERPLAYEQEALDLTLPWIERLE